MKRIQYATLATVTPEGQPWNSPVRAVFDELMNYYWFSDKQGQHSYNVRCNGRVFAAVYDATVPEGQGAGVYILADATELSNKDDIRKAMLLKHGEPAGDPDSFLGDAVRRVYKAVPKLIWTNDVERDGGRFVRDYRIELSQRDLLRAVNQ